MSLFKNALCLASIPDSAGYGGSPPWHLQCHRRASHEGQHRVVFQDKGVRSWSSGDHESVLTKEPSRA